MDNSLYSNFLPIGTICTIRGNNEKVMIIGYYSIEYTNVVKMHDYIGCVYPEGLLKKNNLCSFDNRDITDVIYKGYLSDEYDRLNDVLSRRSPEKKENTKSFSNIVFDENGVVVFAVPTSSKQDTEEEKINFGSVKKDMNNVKNPFLTSDVKNEGNEIKKFDDNVDKWPIFTDIKFDKDGVVISAR